MPNEATGEKSETAVLPVPSISKCPWKKVEPTTSLNSFRDLMDHDLAGKLQAEEDEKYLRQFGSPKTELELKTEQIQEIPVESAEDSDYMLALTLQQQFTDEFNTEMKNYEASVNKRSRVKISMKNFFLAPVSQEFEDESDLIDPVDLDREAISDCEEDEPIPSFNRRGTSGKGPTIITKHNAEICGKRNVAKIMNTFPPEFDTGNVLNRMQVPNKVFNQLKIHSHVEERRMNRLHDKVENATSNLVFDQKTRLILFKALNGCILNEIGSIIATGKESIVVYGKGGTNEQHKMPEEVAIKIFKTTLNEYHTREKYLREDFRFKNRYKSLNSRKMVRLWAEKEMFNLQRLKRSGIPCPDAVLLKKHVLFLSFIGNDGLPAPRLRDAELTDDDFVSAYKQCLNLLQKIYHECKLIHGDFSEYNLLWSEKKIYVIDVAQSVEPYHQNAYTYLLRDCTNISNFFARRTLNEKVLTPEQTFNFVTGLSFDRKGEEFLHQVQAYEKNIRLQSEAIKEKQNFSFDHFFEKSRQEREENSSNSDSDSDQDDDDDENYVDLSTDEEIEIRPKVNAEDFLKKKISS